MTEFMASACAAPAMIESRLERYIELDAKPDVMGMGRVKVAGKYFGLPADAVAVIEEWRQDAELYENHDCRDYAHSGYE